MSLVLSLLALIVRGAIAPPVVLHDTAGRIRQVPDQKIPILVIYEDQDGGKDNRAAKDFLGRVNSTADNRARCEAIAVADVEKYDWWPAKKYVLADIQKSEAQKKTTIYIDWKGAVRKAWGLGKGKNNLVLVAPDGKVLWSSTGTLTSAQLEELSGILRDLGLHVDGL